MIRINLLGRPRPKVKRPFQLKGPLLAIPLVIPLVLAGGFAVYRSAGIAVENATLTTEIQELEKKKLDMATLKVKMEDLAAQELVLNKRLEVIQNLERDQSGPTIMMETVGLSVSSADSVWLTSLVEKQGGLIEFKGNAGSVEAVADFMTQLIRSPYFTDVEIQKSEQKTSGEAAGSFEFSLTAKFALPAPEGEDEEKAPPEGAAAAPGGV